MQAVSVVLPESLRYLPAMQFTQSSTDCIPVASWDLSTGSYVPGGHEAQSDSAALAVVDAYVPWSQLMHAEAAVAPVLVR